MFTSLISKKTKTKNISNVLFLLVLKIEIISIIKATFTVSLKMQFLNRMPDDTLSFMILHYKTIMSIIVCLITIAGALGKPSW